ncbi:MAG: PspC domain-containing protein [Candidatus Yonathbacteria bacterium]|nr:PspC domain-containing protein [Candidatus Yonathbacteria bacterium]NTW47702.1 PspC domain-containing protein [Candidatus Yonathbacteria bacterium]
MKRLFRSDDNKVFAGVCGGLGEYTDVDPVMFRVLWVIITMLTGFFPGVIAYIVTVFVVPSHRGKETSHPKSQDSSDK